MRHEVEVDIAIAEAYKNLGLAQRELKLSADRILRTAGARLVWHGKRSEWNMSLEAALRQLESTATTNVTYVGREAQEALDNRAAAETRISAAQEHFETQNARYGGWSRFFLVPDGHIHSSMHCHTCYVTTEFGWLPELSGLTEADAVAAHGAFLCTVCYPTAPVSFTNGPALKEAAQAAARCPGSGKYVEGNRRYVTCPDCNKSMARTPSGLVRAHKP